MLFGLIKRQKGSRPCVKFRIPVKSFEHPEVGKVEAVDVIVHDYGGQKMRIWFKLRWQGETQTGWYSVWIPRRWRRAKLDFDTDKPIESARPCLWEDHPFADLFLIKMARCAEESGGPDQEG